jgi:hypothetical protein
MKEIAAVQADATPLDVARTLMKLLTDDDYWIEARSQTLKQSSMFPDANQIGQLVSDYINNLD